MTSFHYPCSDLAVRIIGMSSELLVCAVIGVILSHLPALILALFKPMQSVYCAHFGLTREPFNVTPDPSFLYLSASHQVALAKLIYGIRRRRGFVVLTGEVGTGKTTLLQCLLEELNDGYTRSAFLAMLTGGPKDLLALFVPRYWFNSTKRNRYPGLFNLLK